MKFTANEIRDKSFEKNFRGYDKDEVTEFLKILADEWDLLLREKDELEKRLEASEREAKKLKDVEASLFRTLKTAEDTGAAMIEEANKTAKELLQEAQQKAESLMNSAQVQSQKILESTELQAEETLEVLKKNIKTAVRDYEALVNSRLLVLKNLKKISEELEETVIKAEQGLETSSLEGINSLLGNLEQAAVKATSVQYHWVAPTEEVMTDSAEITGDAELPEMAETTVEAVSPEAEDPTSEVTNQTEETQEVILTPEAGGEIIAEAPTAEEEVEKEEEENKNKNKKEGSFFDQLD